MVKGYMGASNLFDTCRPNHLEIMILMRYSRIINITGENGNT